MRSGGLTEDMKIKGSVFSLLLCCLVSGWQASVVGVTLGGSADHESKSAVEPTEIWLMANETFAPVSTGSNANTDAVCEDVEVVPGYFPGSSYGILFSGQTTSSMTIANGDGRYNGELSFTWFFVIRPLDLSSNGVIMAYYGTDGTNGVQLLQTGSLLTVVLPTYGTHSDYSYRADYTTVAFQSTFTLDEYAWNSVALGYNYDKEYIYLTRMYPSSNDQMKHWVEPDSSSSYTVARATGPIKFGLDHQQGNPFNGSISCFGYLDSTTYKSTTTDLPNYCDPSLYADLSLGGRTVIVQPTTSTPSTTSTTSTTSPPSSSTTAMTSSATSPSTSAMTSSLIPITPTVLTSASASPSTSPMTSPSTPTSPTAMSPASTSTSPSTGSPATTSPAATPTTAPTTPMRAAINTKVIERCVHFSLTSNDTTYANSSDVISVTWTKTVKDCVSYCLQISGCATFVLERFPDKVRCSIGVVSPGTIAKPGQMFFTMTTS